MKYAYEDLSDSQFENLIVLLCQQLLGISVQGFAKGPDGGRDAKFVGTAELHPSRANPWKGTTIIQAKHTNGINRSFSEIDFHSNKNEKSILGKEIPRIKNLKQKKQLDNYMLFANRRLTGNSETDIRAHISKECNIPEKFIYLCGLEQLELFLRRFPEIPKYADLDPIDAPLIVSPDDLAEVVQALASQKNIMVLDSEHPPEPRMPYEKKNSLNNMSADYAREQRNRYLKETGLVRTFLADPQNTELMRMYESVTEEFQLKIIAKRKDYQAFDDVLEYLVDLLFDRDPVLRQREHKRLTRIVLFYMYWNCDIGTEYDSETNQTLPS